MISEAYSNMKNSSGNNNNSEYMKIDTAPDKQIPMMIQSIEKEIKSLGISLDKLFGKLNCCSSSVPSPKSNEKEEYNLCPMANKLYEFSFEIQQFRTMIDYQCDALQL